MQRATTPSVKSSGTAGGQATKRVRFLDLLQEIFNPINQPARMTNGFEGQGFRGFAIRQAEELLAVKLPATVGPIGVDLALSLVVGLAGLVKKSLAAPFFDLQSKGG